VVKRSIDQLLEEARAEIERVTPERAFEQVQNGALLIDIRPEKQRREHGEVPEALIIERNVLEWRLDPNSAHRIPEAANHDREVLILCQEGYASSLAAATLRSLGYEKAADVIGGFEAWLSAGLPTVPSRS
jgi:rhodanese-related sulfurtransferase